MNNCLQRIHGKSFFQDESGAHKQRFAAAHGDVIDGSVNGERADVAAGEEQGIYHIRVGGKADLTVSDFENGTVFQSIQIAVAKQGKECFRYEFVGEQSSIAVFK